MPNFQGAETDKPPWGRIGKEYILPPGSIPRQTSERGIDYGVELEEGAREKTAGRRFELRCSIFDRDGPGGLRQATRGEAGIDYCGGDMGRRSRRWGKIWKRHHGVRGDKIVGMGEGKRTDGNKCEGDGRIEGTG